MRAWLLLYVALAADCHPARRERMGDGPPLAPPDEHALCELAAGHAAAWRGLAPFDPAHVPACLGARTETGTVMLHGRPWQFQRFVSPVAEAWLYDDGKAVALVSVFPSSPPPRVQLETTLGPAPWIREVTFAERLERAALPPLVDYERERVYAERGLALLIALSADGTQLVYRLRGFAPTDAGTYFRRFVQQQPVQWQDP